MSEIRMTVPRWIEIAEKELGVKELPAKKHSARILMYHTATALKATDDETPWCSAFVNWCMEQSDIEGTHSALARSWLSWGVACSPQHPPFGAVVIVKRGSLMWMGHVGFFVGWPSANTVRVLGGNQGDAVCFQNIPRSHVLGYRWPS